MPKMIKSHYRANRKPLKDIQDTGKGKA